ncbi:MAG: hypothetical protein KatS3mg089_1014 [Patescibacteria group bacterium]|nr:MAG: hypothetical protein KatS3mg089_1014 [Patescibacteria group bacterium]
MKSPAQKTHATTQKFTEIVDIVDNIVIFTGGNAALVIEITASNFTLLSKKEQDARIYAYAALLNSLTFPIQIIIRNKRMDISSYIKDLEEAERMTKNELLSQHIKLYREFVREMVRVNVVLNKAFYIVIPFSSLEAGLSGVKQTFGKNESEKYALVEAAKKTLLSKAESLHAQLAKLAISSRTLEKEDLIKLYYDIFNDSPIQASQAEMDINTPIIKPA